MLKEDSKVIYAMLEAMNATPAVGGLFTAFYPLVGPMDALQPYCNYSLSQTSKPTKDTLRAYSVAFVIVAKNYDQVTEAADLLQQYFEDNHKGFKFSGSDPSFIDEMDSCIVTTNYNFKIL